MALSPARRIEDFYLKDEVSRKTIDGTGGVAFICSPGTPDPITLYDPDDDTAVTQPVALVRGNLRYAVAKATELVDIHMMSPSGHFISYSNISAQEHNELCVNTLQRENLARIPFTFDWPGQVVATEYDTGLDLPAGALMNPLMCGVDITAIDATETIDFGTLTAGDPNGFGTLVPVGVLGIAVVEAGTPTRGALLGGATSVAFAVLAATDRVSWTLTAGSDTAKGFILLGYTLPFMVRENAF